LMKKRLIAGFLAVFAIVVMTSIVVWLYKEANIPSYFEAQKVCRQIREGNYEGTTLGNAITHPIWLNNIIRPFTGGDYGMAEIPLVVACYEGNLEAVSDMLANGADPNFTYDGTFTALEATYIRPLTSNSRLEENRFHITKLLIEHGADIDKSNSLSSAPMFAAMERCLNASTDYEGNDAIKILRLFLDKGANPINPHLGGTPLHLAAKRNADYCLSVLVKEYGFDVDFQDVLGETPLMIAVKWKHIDSVQAILEMGANVEIVNRDGKTAYDIALELGYTEIAEMVRP